MPISQKQLAQTGTAPTLAPQRATTQRSMSARQRIMGLLSRGLGQKASNATWQRKPGAELFLRRPEM